MIHDRLPIHKTGSQLLGLAARVHAQMPRGFKKTVGDKIVAHCSEMLDLMALANASRGEQRERCIREILRQQRAAAGVAFHFKQHGEWVSPGERAFGLVEPKSITLVRPDGRQVDPKSIEAMNENIDAVTMHPPWEYTEADRKLAVEWLDKFVEKAARVALGVRGGSTASTDDAQTRNNTAAEGGNNPQGA